MAREMAQWVDICVVWRRAGCDCKLGQMDSNGIKPIVTIKHGKVHFHLAPPFCPVGVSVACSGHHWPGMGDGLIAFPSLSCEPPL